MNNKGKKKDICWGVAWTDQKIDVHIIDININSFNDIVTIIKQSGGNVHRIKLSMEHAMAIGFINLDALEKYC